MKNMKRIHKVVIKRMVDESPDTSWLGEYANSPTSEYSIDREHSLDCASQFGRQEWEVSIYATNANGELEEKGGAVFPTEAQAEEYAHTNPAEHETYEINQRDAECDCGGHGDRERGQYRYFNPSFNYVDKTGKRLPENTDDEVRKYVRQDYERMERINRGDICFLGIRADSEINVPDGNGAFIVQEITSGGVWGIESDSDASYMAEVEQEQLAELREQLKAVGFSSRAISAAFRNVEREE